MRLFALFGTFLPILFGQIVSMSGQPFLKNPISKLTTDWFGDRERGIATGVGVMSGPAGIILATLMIIFMLDDSHEQETHKEEAKAAYEFFIILNVVIVAIMVIPSLIFFKNKPPSPPSMLATKPRPQYKFIEATKIIFTSRNYLLIFLHFQLVNTVSVYGSEIPSIFENYTLKQNSIAQMIFCLSGVAGSYLIGLILDKYKKYKTISILQPLMLSAIIFLTWLFNELNGIPKWLVLSVVALAGATMLSISVVSYQYVAEVTYPVDEVFGNSMMNTFNKLFSFAVVLGVSALDSQGQLLLWTVKSFLAVIPALLTQEDLRRLNMKDVQTSNYLKERAILRKTIIERKDLFEKNRVIIDQDLLERKFVSRKRSNQILEKPQKGSKSNKYTVQ